MCWHQSHHSSSSPRFPPFFFFAMAAPGVSEGVRRGEQRVERNGYERMSRHSLLHTHAPTYLSSTAVTSCGCGHVLISKAVCSHYRCKRVPRPGRGAVHRWHPHVNERTPAVPRGFVGNESHSTRHQSPQNHPDDRLTESEFARLKGVVSSVKVAKVLCSISG
jgi:hypothetical protein